MCSDVAACKKRRDRSTAPSVASIRGSCWRGAQVAYLNSREDQTMTNKFADAQIALLRSGVERIDHCIVAPNGKGASARKSAMKMIDAGWLKEIKAKPGSPVWRTDEATGTTYSLKLVAAGLKVIAAHDIQASGANPTLSAPGGEGGDEEKQAQALETKGQGASAIQPNFRQG